MAYAFVQKGTAVQNTALDGSHAVTVTITGVTAGNLLVLAWIWATDALTITSVTDGTAWTVANPANTSAGGSYGQAVYFLPNAGSGTHNVVITMSGAGTLRCGQIFEYSGLKTSSVLDKHAESGSAGNTTSNSATTAATTGAPEMVFAFSIGDTANDAISNASGYTDESSLADNVNLWRFLVSDKRITVDATQSCTVSAGTASHLLTVVSTFIEAAASSTVTSPFYFMRLKSWLAAT